MRTNKMQRENILKANKAYIYRITKNRFVVYLLVGDTLDLLWPDTDDELLPSQICSNSDKYPMYHFYLNGYNYSKFQVIADELRQINRSLLVYKIDGWYPQKINC